MECESQTVKGKDLKIILPMKDISESFFTDKDELWDLPMRLMIIGKSQQSGKTNFLANLLLRPEFYRNDFKGENIFIVSPSAKTDSKLKNIINQLDIPNVNVFESYDPVELSKLYNVIEDQYNDDLKEYEKYERLSVTEKKKAKKPPGPQNNLIVFDDMSFSGALRNKVSKIVTKMYQNGRHILLSTIVTAQQYTSIDPGIRGNVTGAVLYACPEQQLESICNDFCCISSRQIKTKSGSYRNARGKELFKKMFHKYTEKPHHPLIINESNALKHKNQEHKYQNFNFETIVFK